MNQEETKVWLTSLKSKAVDEEVDGLKCKSVYIGSFMSLDPCGKYHHILSPNGLTDECESFWSSLDEIAEELDGAIVCGEGDPTDIYFKFEFSECILS